MRAALLSLLLVPLIASAAPRADVPTPKVTKVAGPGRPFFATDIVLKNFGYVEEEFFYEGQANTYSAPEFGKNAEITKSGIPFRSRLLVRRPAQQSRFNGVVVVEWLNVTNGYDTDVLWLYQKEFFIREGYAWVGVSAQDGGMSRSPNGPKIVNPKRYASVDLTAGGRVTDASLNFDIYSQAGSAVKHVPEVLGGLKHTTVIAAGQSQSAGRMGPYLNGVHNRAPIYDAAMLTVSNQKMRTDLTIPVIKVLSETERFNSRSEPDLPKVRVWNVAGSTHSEQYSLLSRAAFLQRDLKLEAVDTCETPARSRVEIRYVYNAAIDALTRWVKNGTEPAHAPLLEFDETAPPIPQGRGGGSEKPLKRDAHGNIVGGIRLAEIAVPVALESGELCGLGGTHKPFDDETLNKLYPTHADYVNKVAAASNAMVKAGFLLRADADQTIDMAKRSIYGLGLKCGDLCSDVRQFPSHPSSQLLSRQTQYLMIKGGEALVGMADAATKLIAEGYSDPTKTKAKFAGAAAKMDAYIEKTKSLKTQGNMPVETETLLVSQATRLRDLLRQGK